MWLINGVLDQYLPASDRSVQYGDGCFTTARVLNGRVVWLECHIQRLQHAALVLMLPDIDWDLLSAEMQQAAEGKTSGVVKAIVTRGVGGRGYSPLGCEAPVRMVMHSGYPEHYENWRRDGISLSLSPVKLARSPLFAGIKHLNRLEQVMIRRHLDQQQEADEALVLDTHDRLVECCAANLFWRSGKQVFTPDVSQSGVDGLTRRHIMKLLEQSDYQLQVVAAPLDALAAADEVIICNALMPVMSVNRAEAWCYRSRELYDFLSPNCE
ncbi:aminodeoxychorismate lyase [Lonsdalea populi]|uniref:Aminodeoxychorismate lyase n=1 Tax=Lonsdalea populi TaxID=1172565 RepID=A0A3N0U679_9GAMM|nr:MULTISPECIES: aminodeoxychorismate lyase [Lonsdalea]OSM99442.1 aminodeoxychorismate lyase [Lonsdalea populi]OSN01672.1 aminodeoxychorismate lyase [Lonsdalea populi]QPQ25444.1 aminodeoxychorismate lyase [Lonsdalea populi]RAT14523.1 aminodeoxychorismate lyase [Lonsdalea quercina]RAT25692.1 aminodeoxychorismate lyase [Lonsdalea populi]